MKLVWIILGVLTVLILVGWAGLQVNPKPFQPYTGESQLNEMVPLPDGLPAPVERFYRQIYGEQIPVIESVVITGRAKIAPFGVMLPARFVFVHNTGEEYRHYIEATWFGIPLMKVDEGYLAGESFFESPMGDIYDDPAINQAANLAVWAEASWFPAIWVTDPRVEWLPLDDVTAALRVPFEDEMDTFIVRFDPETGLVDKLEAMRYRDSGSEAEKVLWITSNLPGEKINDTGLSVVGSATWLDQGKPWAVFTLEDLVYNADVSKYITQRGE